MSCIKEDGIMKNNWKRKLIMSIAAMLLATGTAWAEPDGHWWGGHGEGRNHLGGHGVHFQAPEIDAASGTSAIALLTGIVLLMKERRRSKRSSKSDE
jgi:hypothetical protein